MKKTLLLTIVCFVLALGVGFSLVTESNEKPIDSLLAYNVDSYMPRNIGDLYGSSATFTVSVSGQILGCNGNIWYSGGDKFTASLGSKGNNKYLGEIVTRQSDKIVVYVIYANVK